MGRCVVFVGCACACALPPFRQRLACVRALLHTCALLLTHTNTQSVWNKANLFTGWTDVELSELGVEEAAEAGKVREGLARCAASEWERHQAEVGTVPEHKESNATKRAAALFDMGTPGKRENVWRSCLIV